HEPRARAGYPCARDTGGTHMNAEQRPARNAPARRKPTGKAPAWALKLGSALLAVAIFGGAFDYATSHLYIANAPLQPALVANAGGTPAAVAVTAATQATLRLNP